MSAINAADLQTLSSRLRTAGAAAGETDRKGDLVMKVGRIARPGWYIRPRAQPEDGNWRTLTLNDVVLVDRSWKTNPADTLSWLYVFAQPQGGGEVVEGWVRSDGVLLDPPEPEARVHYIAKGEKLINIAANYYKPGGGEFKWGDDARFYVAALAYVNKNYKGMIFEKGWTDADFKERGSWADLHIKANHAIWIPKREYLQPLKGKFVSSGSISYELYSTFRSIAIKIWEATVGNVAFGCGLVHGALLAVYDALMDVVELIQLVWKVLKSVFSPIELVKDAKKLWDSLKGTNWRQVMGAIADDFMAEWEADSTWARYYFRGEVIGYIMATAALAFLTAGISAAASAAGKGAKLLKVVQVITNNPTVKKLIDKGEDALKKTKELQEQLAEWRKKRAAVKEIKKGQTKFQVLSEGPKIPGTSVPESLRIRVGTREFDVSRGGTGGPATKHLAEGSKHGSWDDVNGPREAPVGLRQSEADFPMSSLASGLEEAEKQILKKAAPLSARHNTPGVFDVRVDGWHFLIDTNKKPWKVFHAQLTDGPQRTPGVGVGSDKPAYEGERPEHMKKK